MKSWYKNDPYILAAQVEEVIYLPDTKMGKSWVILKGCIHATCTTISRLQKQLFIKMIRHINKMSATIFMIWVFWMKWKNKGIGQTWMPYLSMQMQPQVFVMKKIVIAMNHHLNISMMKLKREKNLPLMVLSLLGQIVFHNFFSLFPL